MKIKKCLLELFTFFCCFSFLEKNVLPSSKRERERERERVFKNYAAQITKQLNMGLGAGKNTTKKNMKKAGILLLDDI